MTEFIKIIIPAIFILLLAYIGLAMTILFRKNGRFPNTHIHGNKYLQDNDIHCVQKEDHDEQMKALEREKFRNLKFRKK